MIKNKQIIKKKNKTNKQQQYKQKQQQHIITPVYITGGDAIRQCSKWSTYSAYIPSLTVTIVQWCHTVMQTVPQHQESSYWTRA